MVLVGCKCNRCDEWKSGHYKGMRCQCNIARGMQEVDQQLEARGHIAILRETIFTRVFLGAV